MRCMIIFLALVVFVTGCSTSDNNLVNVEQHITHNISNKQSKWFSSYPLEITIKNEKSVPMKEINDRNKIIDLVRVINKAPDIEELIEGKYIGVLDFDELGFVKAYVTNDRENVLLTLNKGNKLLRLEELERVSESKWKCLYLLVKNQI